MQLWGPLRHWHSADAIETRRFIDMVDVLVTNDTNFLWIQVLKIVFYSYSAEFIAFLIDSIRFSKVSAMT